MKRSVRPVVTETVTIVGSPDTTSMSAWLPTNEEKSHQEYEAQGMNHLKEREGVGKIVMNEDPPGEGLEEEGLVHQELHKKKTSRSCW